MESQPELLKVYQVREAEKYKIQAGRAGSGKL
jgi:hypothetical protein